jgi:hypothetical protein
LRDRFVGLNSCFLSPALVAFFDRILKHSPIDWNTSDVVVVDVMVDFAFFATDVSVEGIAIETLMMRSLDDRFLMIECCFCWYVGFRWIFDGTSPLVPVMLLEPNVLLLLAPVEIEFGEK